MNVLEKILDEIEDIEKEYATEKYHEYYIDGACCAISDIRALVRFHLGEAKDINAASSDELIDRKSLKKEIESLRMTITGMRSGKTMTAQALEEYKKSILRIIDEQPLPEPYKPEEDKP